MTLQINNKTAGIYEFYRSKYFLEIVIGKKFALQQVLLKRKVLEVFY